MEESIENSILGTITKVDESTVNLSAQKEIENQALKITSVTDTANVSSTSSQHKDIGRNDPCPCGAKKSDGTPVKYKNCHGK